MGKSRLQVIGTVGTIAIIIAIFTLYLKLDLGGTSPIPKDKYVFLQVEENISGAPVWIESQCLTLSMKRQESFCAEVVLR